MEKIFFFIRRKRESACFPPPDADTSNAFENGNCICSENDYQCDFCFAYDSLRKCRLDRDECPDYDPKKKPNPCVDYWYETSGYRLVPGDTCSPKGGVLHPPIKRNC